MSTAPSIAPTGRCFLKTRGENFKEYMIELSSDALLLCRPKSAKQQQLVYRFSQFQCCKNLQSEFQMMGKTPAYSLSLITSPTQQRLIYFLEQPVQQWWYLQIL